MHKKNNNYICVLSLLIIVLLCLFGDTYNTIPNVYCYLGILQSNKVNKLDDLSKFT